MSLFAWSVRERTILAVLVLVCCVYGAYTWIYRPSLADEDRLAESVRTTRKKFQEELRVIEKEKRAPQALREALEKRRQKASPQETVSGLLSEIEASARAMNIRVTEMKPLSAFKNGEFNQFAVSLAVDGNFKEIMAFIHGLQSPGHDLDITQFFFERPFGESKTLQAKIVVVRTLIRQDAAAAGKTE